jgi:hypothetical protein
VWAFLGARETEAPESWIPEPLLEGLPLALVPLPMEICPPTLGWPPAPLAPQKQAHAELAPLSGRVSRKVC